MVKQLAVPVLLACLAGCATDSKWPQLDEDKARFVLVAGEFSHVRALDENNCLFTNEDLLSGTADCWSGTPSVATLNVYDVLYGNAHGERLSVAYHPTPPSDQPPGYGRPQLVLLGSDGRHHVLNAKKPIALTVRGEWALPVSSNSDLAILPCGAKPLVRPLLFANPRPGGAIEDYAASVEELQANPRMKVRDGRAYITHGILLTELRHFMATATPEDPEEYYCEQYEDEDADEGGAE